MNFMIPFKKKKQAQTVRRRLEAFKVNEERFTLAAAAAQMAVWEWNIRSDRVIRSRKHDAFYGYSKNLPKWSYHSFLKHIHPDDILYVHDCVQSAVQGRAEYYVEFRVIWPADKSVHWLMCRGKVYWKNGKPERLLGVVMEISAKKNSEEERNRYLEQLQNEKDLREKFISSLTHDLRTPLTAAKGYVQLINRRATDPEVCRDLSKKAVDSMNRLESLIQNLLDASRIRAGEKLPLKIEHCDLTKLAQKTVEELNSIHGNRFILKASESIQGFWDPSTLQRVIENLGENAVKYGEPNSPIILSLGEKGDQVELSVHNEGKGLTSKEQERLFHWHHRTNEATESGLKGWGIGLTLVRGVAESHGGTVRVESSPLAGTTFIVVLPKGREPGG